MTTKEKKDKMIKEADKAYDDASKYKTFDERLAAAQMAYDKASEAAKKGLVRVSNELEDAEMAKWRIEYMEWAKPQRIYDIFFPKKKKKHN